MSRYVSPVETITDLNGAPMVGAKLVFYETGTATLKTVYSDSGLSVPLANPVTAVSSGAGAIYPDIYLDGIYKVVQQDDTGTAGVADGAVLWTRDPVGDVASGNFETWLNDSTYNIPQVVYASDDKYYISLVDANQGNEPSVSPAQWQLIPVKDMGNKAGSIAQNFSVLSIVDASDNEIITPVGVASAVNEITVTNAATGSLPSINQTGENVGLTVEGLTLHNGVLTGTSADFTGEAEGSSLSVNGAAGTNRFVRLKTSGVMRWTDGANSAAESGSNAGSDFVITRYGDAGTLIDSPLTINRATGSCTISNLSPSSAGTAIAGQAAGGIGTYAWLGDTTQTSTAAGSTRAGSNLRYAGIEGAASWANLTVSITGGMGNGGTPSGTWRAMGYSYSNTTSIFPATLWLRIS